MLDFDTFQSSWRAGIRHDFGECAMKTKVAIPVFVAGETHACIELFACRVRGGRVTHAWDEDTQSIVDLRCSRDSGRMCRKDDF